MLYHFQLELSDIDRGVYESLDFRIAQHPSETLTYLLTRVLGYALSYQQGLEFSGAGLADPEAPAMKALGLHGAVDVWIEIGNPSARKLHKASKVAKQVVVYTYKSAALLLEEIHANTVHRADEIKIVAFNPKFLQELEATLEKNNRWSLLLQNDQLEISVAAHQSSSSLLTDIKRF